MKIIRPSIRVVDALSGWGIREATNSWKYPAGVELPTDADEQIIFGTEFVIRHVPQLIAGLLCAEPLDPLESGGAFRADFDAEDVNKLFTLYGDPLTTMAVDEYAERLVKAPNWDPAPIVCAVQTGCEGPFVIFDGCHRAKAWLLRGETRRLTADVIRTKESPLKIKFVPRAT
jgi:hypothetical protein